MAEQYTRWCINTSTSTTTTTTWVQHTMSCTNAR